MEHKTTDQQFNESYTSKGMQPSVGVRPAIRNKKIIYREENQKSTLVHGRPKKQTFNNSGIRSVKKKIRNKEKEGSIGMAGEVVEKRKENRHTKQPHRKFVAQKNKKNKRGKTIIKKRALKRKAAKIKRVVSANKIFFSFFLGTVWWIQIIFALISALLLAASLAISSFAKTSVVSEGAGFLEKISNWALNTLKEVVTTLYSALSTVSEYLFGINFYDPMNWFIATYLLLFAYFIIQSLIIYIVYRMYRIDPLLGSGSGLKMGAFLLSFVLYCLPVLNMFPWFILWSSAVLAATVKE